VGLELFELGISLIKSLFQWKVENGKWKIVFISPYNACSLSQDKPSLASTTSSGRGCHGGKWNVTGEGKNKNNPNTISKIFNTIFHFPLSIFNSLSICWGRNPNLQLPPQGQKGGCKKC